MVNEARIIRKIVNCYIFAWNHTLTIIVYFSSSRIKYVAKASQTLRAALKEPSKSKASLREGFAYNLSLWKDGKQGAKTRIQSLSKAGASA